MDKREKLNSGNYFKMFDTLAVMFTACVPDIIETPFLKNSKKYISSRENNNNVMGKRGRYI